MRQPLPFGKYLLLERISVGGMAEVFKAKSFGVEGFEKIIAIKRILPSIAEDQEFIQMFIDEAKISGQLSHANICQIFELDRISDSHFIAMEFVWGKDLLQIQNRFRKLKQQMPMQMAAFVAAKMCEGLDYAHRKKDALGRPLNIIHRDVSPQNILCSYEGEVKVIDFGIAKAASRSSKTQAGVLKGKFGYMSPEQVRGLPLDRRSDVFAIGTILYEMLTGERLFLGESDFSTLEKVRNVDVHPPSSVNKAVPPALERIAMKALSKTTEDRYQWAKEMQDDLQSYLMSTEPVYSSRQLAQWMKEAFSPELEKERALLEQYKRVGREALTAAAASSSAVSSSAHLDQTPHPLVRGAGATVATPPPGEEGVESTVVGEMPAFDGSGDMPATRAMTNHDDLGDAPLDGPLGDHGPTELGGVNLDWDPRATGATAAATPAQMRARAGEDAKTEALTPAIVKDPSNGEWRRMTPEDSITPLAEPKPSLATSTPTVLEHERPPSSIGLGAVAAAATAAAANRQHAQQHGGPAPRGSILPPSAGGPPIPYDLPRAVAASVEGRLAPRVSRTRELLASPAFRPILEGAVGGAAMLLLVIGAYFAFRGGRPTLATGILLVTTGDVAGAEVWVDGEKKGDLEGNDHLALGNLLPKTYQVEVRRAGAPACAKEATVEADGTAIVACRPEIPMGILRLRVKPGSATASVDGVERPLDGLRQGLGLPAGSHDVRVRGTGYQEQAFTVKLEAGKPLERSIELSPEAALTETAGLGGDPGKERDPGAAARERERAAKEREREKDRERDKTRDKTPTGAGTGADKVVIPATGDGYLIANTTPWARVLVDSKDTGKMTPIAPKARIALPPGKHTITFVVGDKKFPFPVTIEAGKELRLQKTLPL